MIALDAVNRVIVLGQEMGASSGALDAESQSVNRDANTRMAEHFGLPDDAHQMAEQFGEEAVCAVAGMLQLGCPPDKAIERVVTGMVFVAFAGGVVCEREAASERAA